MVEQFFKRYGEILGIAEQRSGERETIERRLGQSRAELAAVLDGRLAEALGGDDADAYIETVRQRREAVEAEEEALFSVEDTPRDLPPPTELREDWENRTLEQKRVLIGTAFEAIFLRRARSPREPVGDRLRFFRAGTAPPLPVRGQRTEIRSVDID